MRKNIEPKKDKNGKVKDGFHQIGQVCVDSGQIAIVDPCNMGDEPDTIVSTNFGDGIFPIFEYWENNKRLDLCIPLSTELHNELQDHLKKFPDPPSYKKDNLKPGEFNPKDIGIDGYEYIEDMEEDYKKQ